MRTLKCVGIIFILIVLNLGCETNLEKSWQIRKELLLKDPSVVRYYTFEGVVDTDSIVKDLSGKGGDLTFRSMKADKKEVGKLAVVEGRFPGKKAVRLDRGYYQGSAVEIEGNAFTAECWFRRTVHTTKYEKIETSASTLLLSGAGYKGWILTHRSGRVGSIKKTPEGEEKPAYFETGADKSRILEGVWQHAALVWNGQEVLFYLNGEIAARRKYEGNYNPAQYPFRVGYNALDLIDLDEIVIHNKVLSPDEIKKVGGGEEGLATDRINKLFANSDILIKKKDFEGARREYEKIKGIDGIDYGQQLALFNIAESYRLEGKHNLADRVYTEILSTPSLNVNYKAYTLFTRADMYKQQGKYPQERNSYEQVLKLAGISENDTMRANRGIGDTYRSEKRYTQARQIYEKLLVEVSSKYNPNEVHRLELIDRLEAIDELKDGETEVSEREKRIVLINTPECEIYVSVGGKDTGKGTKESPFATIGRAQEEVRKIKKEKGLPQKGVVVYLRKGEYFIDDTIIFTEEDSGTENAPVIYRSFSEESVRIIGGKRISNFKPLNDPLITERLPREANGRVWVADLKEAGITEYGTIKNRGTGTAQTGAMELIYNGKVMQMARWPNEGWTRVASLVNPKGDYFFRNEPYQRGKFKYSGDRPARWTEEKDIWIWGYLGPKVPYVVNHLNISSIDTANKTIYTKEDPRWTHVKDPAYIGDRISKNTPYFVFNVLSEIDIPGEYYLDRETGKIYFYPPDNMKGEAIVTTLNKPIIEFKNASNIVLYKITAEGAWQDAILVSGGEKNLIAGCTVRNIGQNGIYIESGWNHGIVGCDICDVGEGAVKLVNYRLYGHGFTPSAENRRKLIPNGCYIENTFISRVNRLTGNSIAVSVSGIGQRVSHNLITDSSHSAMDFTCNNNIIEYNEIHDVVAHSREVGAIYTWDIGQPLTYRGNILKNNFLHHVTGHYSPNFTHGASAVHIDGLSSNITISGNILYRTNAISSSAPDCRFENNTFVDCFPGLSLGNRGSIIESDGKLNKAGYTLFTVFKNFGYNTPPWSVRYPELSDIFNPKKRPIGWPRNITVERNISSGGALVQFGAGVRTGNTVTDNIDGQDPFFYNKKSLDFRVRPGSPVYGQIGFEPVDFQKIGLYNDPLRASWPVNREIGKYYDLTKETAEIKQKKYDVIRRTAPIKIDGKLDKNEWMGLDRSKAIVIDKYYRKTQEEASCKSYTWIMYDDEYLYIGVEHEPDPWTEEMPVTLKDLPIDWGMVEVSVEGKVIDETSSWWLPDMETGPIYIFTGFPNGNLKILDSYFKIPASLKAELAKKSQYASVMHDISTYKWSAEFKIPLDILNIKPSEVDSTRFNIGARKRKDWIGWAYTIGPIWRLEGGGQIRFIK